MQRLIKRREAIFVRGPVYFLERALLFSFCVHGIAMLAMLCFLLAGLPGGPNDGAARMAYVASSPWLWRLGWFSWQLTALSDLLISLALLRIRWGLVAILTVVMVVAGMVPDQMGQVLWMTRGVELAQQGSLAAYSQFEAMVFGWISVYGGTFYTLAAVGWTWWFVTQGEVRGVRQVGGGSILNGGPPQGGRPYGRWLYRGTGGVGQGEWGWTRSLTIYSIMLWGLFAFLSIDPLLPVMLRLPAVWIAGGNALGFVLLLAWFVLVTEMVLRQRRPDQMAGRYAPWRYHRGSLGRVLDLIGNSRFLRTLGEYVPVPAFLSDITDVIYVNYIVEASELEQYVPAGLELQRLGPDGRYAFFTFLTYSNGHFGPRFFGKLRKLLPSPVQSNWRIHVRDPRTDKKGIFFVATVIGNPVVALGARVFAEGMPMHVPRGSGIYSDKDGNVSMYLDSGKGSAPDVQVILRRMDERPEQGPWSVCFASYEEMLAYCVPQDRAFSSQPWYGRVTRQEIKLGIPLDICQPLEGKVYSRAAQRFVGDAEPFCFYVANVNFRLEGEMYEPMA